MESHKEKYPVDGGFLQSEHWANFQREVGRRTVETDSEKFKTLMIFNELPIVGGYFFIPRGPIFDGGSDSGIIDGMKKLLDEADKHSAAWIRVEPQTTGDLDKIKSAVGDTHKVVKSKKDHEPKQTLILDLTKTEEEIFVGMKQKTRYNVRLADRRGVVVESSRDQEAIDDFLRLTKITAQRDGITTHPSEYFRKMLDVIGNDQLKLYIARYEGKTIAANLVSFYGGVATYLHGSSSNENRNVMAPFALQRKAMLDAKKLGCTKYDFGGTRIDKEGRCVGGWAGISRFKQGFCPKCQPVEFPGCWDVVVDGRKYYIYKVLQAVKDKIGSVKR